MDSDGCTSYCNVGAAFVNKKKKRKKLANIQVVQQTPAQYVRQSLAIYLFLDTNLGP